MTRNIFIGKRWGLRNKKFKPKKNKEKVWNIIGTKNGKKTFPLVSVGIKFVTIG